MSESLESCEECQVWINELNSWKNNLVLYKGVYVYPCEACENENS
jgi:hypothetical protein